MGNAVVSTWLTCAVPPFAPAVVPPIAPTGETAARTTRRATRPLSRRGMCHHRVLVQHVHPENSLPDRHTRTVRQRRSLGRDGPAVDDNAGHGRRRRDRQPVLVASYVGMNPFDSCIAG